MSQSRTKHPRICPAAIFQALVIYITIALPLLWFVHFDRGILQAVFLLLLLVVDFVLVLVLQKTASGELSAPRLLFSGFVPPLWSALSFWAAVCWVVTDAPLWMRTSLLRKTYCSSYRTFGLSVCQRAENMWR